MRIEGLKRRTDLNGAIVVLHSFEKTSKGQYTVEIENSKSQLLIDPENLVSVHYETNAAVLNKALEHLQESNDVSFYSVANLTKSGMYDEALKIARDRTQHLVNK